MLSARPTILELCTPGVRGFDAMHYLAPATRNRRGDTAIACPVDIPVALCTDRESSGPYVYVHTSVAMLVRVFRAVAAHAWSGIKLPADPHTSDSGLIAAVVAAQPAWDEKAARCLTIPALMLLARLEERAGWSPGALKLAVHAHDKRSGYVFVRALWLAHGRDILAALAGATLLSAQLVRELRDMETQCRS